MSDDVETHFDPPSTSYGSYVTTGFPMHDLTFHVESDFDPNTMPGGIPMPYLAERFGSTSILHLPSQRWKLPLIYLLGLELVIP